MIAQPINTNLRINVALMISLGIVTVILMVAWIFGSYDVEFPAKLAGIVCAVLTVFMGITNLHMMKRAKDMPCSGFREQKMLVSDHKGIFIMDDDTED